MGVFCKKGHAKTAPKVFRKKRRAKTVRKFSAKSAASKQRRKFSGKNVAPKHRRQNYRQLKISGQSKNTAGDDDYKKGRNRKTCAFMVAASKISPFIFA
jgi:hypothetical protein